LYLRFLFIKCVILHVVEKLARSTFIDINAVDVMLRVQVLVVLHGIDVEINVVTLETPALI
jgi:hypothetical protein